MKVAVLFGGRSAEHEISVQSAKTVMARLDRGRYQALPVRIGRDGRWESPVRRIARADVVFPVLHGPMGEDGTVQGLLELLGKPYVGCGVMASAVGMDKGVSARLAAAGGIPVLPHVLLRSPDDLAGRRAELRRLGLPVFVKPCGLGSSVGVHKVKSAGTLSAAVKDAFRFDTRVLIEKGVDAQEICVAVLGEPGAVQASVCGEIEVTGRHDFFDYQSKYFDDDGHRLHIPARLPAAEARRLKELAIRAFEAHEGHGMARVDFLVDRRSRKPYLGEINTIPGFTSHSLYPKLWEASGLPLPKLLDRLIALALKRRRGRAGLRLKP